MHTFSRIFNVICWRLKKAVLRRSSSVVGLSHILGVPRPTHRLSSTPMAKHDRATFDQAGPAWRSHFKDGKMMLVGCVATSIGRQSCTNLPGICRTSGWRRAMTFEIGRLFKIGRQSIDHRVPTGRFQRTSPDDIPIPQLAWRCPSPDAQPMSPDYLSMLLRLRASKNL